MPWCVLRGARPTRSYARAPLTGCTLGILACAAVLAPPEVRAQQLTKQEYIRYVPLDYPRIVRQTDANAAFHLFGNASTPRYRDVDPADGIDDARGAILHALGVRFAPWLVQNTTMVPMDHRRFMDLASSWPMYIDTWDLTRSPELVREERIDLAAVARSPCREPATAAESNQADCRLLTLLDEFDPDNPQHARARTGARPAEGDSFKVLYYDFPGHDESSWKAEYTGAHSGTLPEHYRDFVKTYMHPFIQPIRSNVDATESYEFVLQYWFFYPSNDGGNNHEGDWEHLGVVITPLDRVGEPLQPAEIQSILDGTALGDEANPLVISRLDYYIHNSVMQIDLSRPNVYLPRAAWEAAVADTEEQLEGEEWIWREMRRRAWIDDAETIINTHPYGYIGADNKGTDQLLSPPGGRNRDSHATYPFAGLYKGIGPAGASEQVSAWVDFRAYRNDPSSLDRTPFARGWVQRLDEPERVEVLPDWERIRPLLRESAEFRKHWSWLILPLRWGNVASASPFAGIVAHAETGNLAPVGPAYSSGWNRPGVSGGFAGFAPHRFSGYFALGWLDNFRNDWGFLNATLPTLVSVPPLDLAYRLLLAPVHLIRGRHHSTFFDSEGIPFRFLGVVAGSGWEDVPEAFNALLLNRAQLGEILDRIAEADSTLTSPLGREFVEDGRSRFAGVDLFIGRSFVSENAVKRTSAKIGEEVALSTLPEPFVLEGDLEIWEYVGSLRYNLAVGGIEPYARVGWGWSWYRLTDVNTQGNPLSMPDTDWVDTFTWHFGAGFEFLPIRGRGRGLRGLDAGIRGDVIWYRHALGADQIADPVFLAAGNAEQSVTRRQLSLAFTLSY